MGKFDDAAFKKGFTVVVRDALRVGVREGKQGFVEVELGDVKVSRSSVLWEEKGEGDFGMRGLISESMNRLSRRAWRNLL